MSLEKPIKTAINTAQAFALALDPKNAEGSDNPDAEQSKKQQKETDEIKGLLKAFNTYQKRIDNTEERLAFLELKMYAPSSPSLSGMPSGGHDGTSKQERTVLIKLELEEKLQDMYAEENRQREEIESLIEQMDNPDEQTAIEMRYLDRANWKAISVVLHGSEPDYDEHEQRYLKRTFKIHGSALQTLARIYKDQKESH